MNAKLIFPIIAFFCFINAATYAKHIYHLSGEVILDYKKDDINIDELTLDLRTYNNNEGVRTVRVRNLQLSVMGLYNDYHSATIIFENCQFDVCILSHLTVNGLMFIDCDVNRQLRIDSVNTRDGDLSTVNCKFAEAELSNLKVGRLIIFGECKFGYDIKLDSGNSDRPYFQLHSSELRSINVSNSHFYRDASFLDLNVLNSFTIDKHCFFETSATIEEVDIRGTLKFTNPYNIELYNVTCGKDLDISHSNLDSRFVAHRVTIQRSLLLRNDTISNSIELREVKTSNFDVGGISLGKSGHLFIDGLTFNSITWHGNSLKEYLNRIVTLMNSDSVIADKSFYVSLENYLRNNGQSDLADEVYFKGEFIESSLWKTFLYHTVGLGKRPILAFLWSALIIMIGCMVYWKSSYMVTTEEKNVLPYSMFWYSFDLFIPVVNLKMSEAWSPNPELPYSWFRINYGRIQRILGWVLIPIGLAAVSGLIQS